MFDDMISNILKIADGLEHEALSIIDEVSHRARKPLGKGSPNGLSARQNAPNASIRPTMRPIYYEARKHYDWRDVEYFEKTIRELLRSKSMIRYSGVYEREMSYLWSLPEIGVIYLQNLGYVVEPYLKFCENGRICHRVHTKSWKLPTAII